MSSAAAMFAIEMATKPGKQHSPALKNITRFDYRKTHGYWVRFEGAAPTTKLFSDGVYGGKRNALKAAQEFRDEWVATHDLTRRRARRAPPGPGTLRRKWHWQRKSWSLVWEAYIKVTPERGHAATRYSIDKWGSAEAKRRCESWLERKRKEQAKAYGMAANSKSVAASAKTEAPSKKKATKKSASRAGASKAARRK
jgi:hypothetical protein